MAERWLDIQNEDLDVDAIHELLEPITDDLWVVTACVDRALDDLDVQRDLLSLGLRRSKAWTQRIQHSIKDSLVFVSNASRKNDHVNMSSLDDYLLSHPLDKEMCRLRAILLDRWDRILTYQEMARIQGWDAPVSPSPQVDSDEESIARWGVSTYTQSPSSTSHDGHLRLSTFLTNSLLHSGWYLSTRGQLGALSVMMLRHPSMTAQRFLLLGSIPEFINPSDYYAMLPGADPSTGVELMSMSSPWRDALEWVEVIGSADSHWIEGHLSTSITWDDKQLLSSRELSQWYIQRVYDIDQLCGSVEVQLKFVEHAISQNVTGLDVMEEDLKFLSSLLDISSRTSPPRPIQLSLQTWQDFGSREIVDSYLSHSNATTVVEDIRHFVIPCLIEREAKRRCAGKEAGQSISALICSYLLHAPLDIVTAVFEASKPTEPAGKRIVNQDWDMVRTALACLYGSDALSQWTSMSRIFECLPVSDETYPLITENRSPLSLLHNFVSVSQANCSPSDFFLFFETFSNSALSQILDVLDLHLVSGEIFTRWGVAVPLREFLYSMQRPEMQRAHAIMMSQHFRNDPRFDHDANTWSDLLDDMLKLVGDTHGTSGGAFESLSRGEVIRIFFRGLLSSGDFPVAKILLQDKKSVLCLSPADIEALCLEVSREFFDNSNSGNLHDGGMKLAYDCLSVPTMSKVIQTERNFIEATSRICSFSLRGASGMPTTPLEIRLIKNRLELVPQILSSTPESYKHPDVILDLIMKLGFQDSLPAMIEALAMTAEYAMQHRDFSVAVDINNRMVHMVHQLRKCTVITSPPSPISKDDAVEMYWTTCYKLGRQTEFRDIDQRMIFLGNALDQCPSNHIMDVLSYWKTLQREKVGLQKRQADKSKTSGRISSNVSHPHPPGFVTSHLRDLRSGLVESTFTSAEAAITATRTFNRVATNLPFTLKGPSEGVEASQPRAGSPDISTQARHALAKGIGWLIGAGDPEDD